MDAVEAIRSRRTIKAFKPEPLTRNEIDGLLELARWAPNHKLTCPWRFRVIGEKSLARLKLVAADLARETAPPEADSDVVAAVAAAKLDRAPTLVVVSHVINPDPVLNVEDSHATAIAAYIVLLGAHDHGFAGYWRTPAVLRAAAGIAAVGVPSGEEVIGLLHLGNAAIETPATAPERPACETYVSYLD